MTHPTDQKNRWLAAKHQKSRCAFAKLIRDNPSFLAKIQSVLKDGHAAAHHDEIVQPASHQQFSRRLSL